MSLSRSLFSICLLLVSSEAQIGLQSYTPPSGPTPRPPYCDPICILGCPKIFCLHGSIKLNPCDCCPVCAKDSGADCGGVNKEFGICAEGLICQTTGNPISRGVCQTPRTNAGSTSIRKSDLVHFVANLAPSGGIYDAPNSEDNGPPGPVVPSTCPPPKCAAVLCASPDALGCPNSFETDPCQCCPRCIYN